MRPTGRVICTAGSTGDHLKEQTTKFSSRVLEFARSAGLIVMVTAGPLAACASDTGDGDSLDQAASDLKGGIPAGKGKGKAKDEVAGSAAVVEDAGPADDKGKGQDKVKKDKAAKDKPHGKSAEAGGGDADEETDETL
jgi:hypothetical protein